MATERCSCDINKILALHIIRENVLLHDPVLLREEVDEDSLVALVSEFVLPLELHQH